MYFSVSVLMMVHNVATMIVEWGRAELVSASIAKPKKTLKHVQGDALHFSFSLFSFDALKTRLPQSYLLRNDEHPFLVASRYSLFTPSK